MIAAIEKCASGRNFLVVGGDSALGGALVKALETGQKRVWQTTRNRVAATSRRFYLDLEDEPSNWSLPEVQFDVVFICAAVTSIKRCQEEPQLSRRVNVSGTAALATRLADDGAFVVFTSSNAVFDGQMPYAKATDPVNPRSEYGRMKAEAERTFLGIGRCAAVVRFAKIVPRDLPLFRDWINAFADGRRINPYSDMRFAPVSAGFAVEVLMKIAERKLHGIFQVSANADITYADAARYLAEKVGADSRLIEPAFSGMTGPLRHPDHTTLDGGRLAVLGLELPHPMSALDQFDWRISS